MNIKPIIGTLTAIGIATLSGCGGIPGKNALRDGDRVPTVRGSYVTDNNTPYSDALHCVGDNIARAHPKKAIRVSLAGIPDRTGKVSNQDGGYKSTQGAESMAYSALGKIGPQVRLVERTYTEVFNFELKLATDKLLGDHKEYVINNGEQKRKVNWRPLMTGSVTGSDLFIAGAITELNYNIASGGIEAGVDGYFGRARTYHLNVGLDLRIVDTRTLEIVHTTSLQKQIVGYEVKAGLFRFFGSNLFDFNLGEKSDEPMHMGIRSVIESAIVELIAEVYGVAWRDCIKQAERAWETDDPSLLATESSSLDAIASSGSTEREEPIEAHPPVSSALTVIDEPGAQRTQDGGPARTTSPAPTKVASAGGFDAFYAKNVTIEGEDWLRVQDPSRYTLQLLAMRDEQSLLTYLRKHEFGDQVAYFSFVRDCKRWFAAVYGSYAGLAEANHAVRNLPATLEEKSPWIRPLKGIQAAIGGPIA